MKKIVLMALLGAAGCSKKGPDCSAAIDRGIDGYVAAMKKLTADSPRLDLSKIADKLKAAMTQRCSDDRWQPDAVACVGKVTSSDDLKVCEDKLTRDQRTKLETQVSSIVRGGMGASGLRMPPGLEGHPQMLGGTSTGSAAPPGSSAPAGAAPAPPAPSGTPAAPPAPPSGGW